MEENAYLTAVIAGTFYMIAGVRLLRLGLRTREHPELMLSAYFAGTGIWYLITYSPYYLRFDSLSPQADIAAYWIFVIGVFPYLFFIRRVFRPNAAWASGMVVVCGVFLVLGGAHLIVESPLVETLDNPWFIVMWLGYAVPAMWMGWEAKLAHRSARKRARIGLCDPVVANRYLLLAWFGCFQTLAVLVGLYWAYDKDVNQATSLFADALLGGTEIAGVSMLWLAFFPPAFYRNWIAARAVILPTPMDS